MTTIFDKAKLQQIMPAARDEDIDRYLDALNTELPKYGVDTGQRMAHFIAQIAHESGSFKYKSENLNYSAKALRAVFSKYFYTDEMAERYARKPEDIANVVYANRMGNGNSVSGDGWRYRGRGLIQLTGRENYAHCAEFIGMDCESNPHMLAEKPVAAVSAACWFWQSRKLNDLADIDDLKSITRKINGGFHGLDSRAEFFERAKAALNIA
ncbi:MAG: glycoside hydrolase family 19 protein [Algicola sp.]|nr:glycoside hydrolase family 19 protein [Algicola sp.]